MPELLVMRHGKSDWSTGLPDFDRPLAKRGARDAPAMAAWLVANDLVPDSIITSAATRALATATHVAAGTRFDTTAMRVVRDLYGASMTRWLEVLAGQVGYERTLVCGHNPELDELVDFLSADPLEYTDNHKLMTTAAIAVFEVRDWSRLGRASARLVQLVRPKDLA